MIETVELTNYRSFREATLPDCRRVNVIVGENASGKTALLEGMFLAAGPSPEIALRVKGFRGMEGLTFEGQEWQANELMWRDLFFQFNTKKAAYVSLSGKETSSTRSITITYRERNQLIIPQKIERGRKNRVPKIIEQQEFAPINFRWRWPHGHFSSIDPKFAEGKVALPSGIQDSNVDSSFFAASRTYSIKETASRFSALSRAHKEGDAIRLFSEHFPQVKNISLESYGGQAILYAEVDNLSEKIPLNMISSGMTKLAAILFSIPNQRHGVILIDEIENGFYYKRFPILWRSLMSFAREYDVQVFASTHSAECLSALLDAAGDKYLDELSLIRVEKEDGASVLRQFSGNMFKAGMEMDGEVR